MSATSPPESHFDPLRTERENRDLLRAERDKAVSSIESFQASLNRRFNDEGKPASDDERGTLWQYEEGACLFLPSGGHDEVTNWQGIVDRLYDMAREAGGAKHVPPPLRRIDSVAEAKAAIDDLRRWANAIAPVKNQTKKSEGDKPTPGRGGRTPVSASQKPEDKAKRNVYELIRAVKEENPSWGKKKLLEHFKNDKDFKQQVKNANLDYDAQMFHAALQWIKENPLVSQETQSENVS